MQVDDRSQLTAVWLVDGPGPEAVWPIGLSGKYAATRGEWYFPKGTSAGAILDAATPSNEHGSPAVEQGLYDPLVEELEERSVEVHCGGLPAAPGGGSGGQGMD